MDYFCFSCRNSSHSNTLKGRRCPFCKGRLRRMKGGVPPDKDTAPDRRWRPGPTVVDPLSVEVLA